jgi:hypothetical protein
MEEVSYIKTQWWRLLIALFSLVMACIYIFKPAPDTTTVEGLDTLITYIINAGLYFFSFIIWVFQSVLEYNSDRIELLEKKAEKYDALCDNVKALSEANRIDREYINLLEQRINQIKYNNEN